MSTEESTPKRSLSEISHLFLSSVREKQTQGAALPQRIPPGHARLAPTLPLSPDAGSEQVERQLGTSGRAARRARPVTAILGAHFNGQQFDRVKEYARHLAATHGRIGLIELDASEFRLMSFEANNAEMDLDDGHLSAAESFDTREMAEALEEMNWDVDRWLLLVPSPRTPEARALLRTVDHWVLLSTCDHDGVVSSYRLLKGLAESYRPRVSLALLDSTDNVEVSRIFHKLAGVCQQFLNWELEDEPAVLKTPEAAEHLVMCCRPTRDKGQIAAAPQWEIVSNFLQSMKGVLQAATPSEPETHYQEAPPMDEAFNDATESTYPPATAAAPFPTAQRSAPHPYASSEPVGPRAFPMYPAGATSRRDTSVDVIDLPLDGGVESILTAILQQNQGELVECPVRIPMCDGARLAITRERGMVLLAVCREGLSGLRAIGQAYRWISENRALIGMAVPQFAIDPNRTPLLRLLVDHGDVSADVLQPILQSNHVTVQAYRKLRWGGKTGLFLEAA